MTVKKAIEILKIQKEKIDNPKNKNQNWVFQTASYIKDFFGEDSTEFSFISQFHFHIIKNSWDNPDDVRRWLSEKPIEAKIFLDNCIETIQNKGLFKPQKQNFLYRLSDTTLWSLITLIIPSLISIGFFFGNLYSDKQNIGLREDNKQLKDSLTLLTPNINNKSYQSPKRITNKTAENK